MTLATPVKWLLGLWIFASLSQAQESGNTLIYTLQDRDYFVYQIEGLHVINSTTGIKNKSTSIRKQKLPTDGHHLIVSGTYTYKSIPTAAVMRDGVLDIDGPTKTRNRGAIAILNSGKIIIGRMNGQSAEAIQTTFGKDEPVRDFMGGAALLIENGAIIPSLEDLFKIQNFDQGGKGISCGQMRKTNHVLFFQRQGITYLAIAKNKNGKQIVKDFSDLGVDNLIKLDGGSGIYLRDNLNPDRQFNGYNVTGFRVKAIE